MKSKKGLGETGGATKQVKPEVNWQTQWQGHLGHREPSQMTRTRPIELSDSRLDRKRKPSQMRKPSPRKRSDQTDVCLSCDHSLTVSFCGIFFAQKAKIGFFESSKWSIYLFLLLLGIVLCLSQLEKWFRQCWIIKMNECASGCSTTRATCKMSS